jgi:hypothetical protein
LKTTQNVLTHFAINLLVYLIRSKKSETDIIGLEKNGINARKRLRTNKENIICGVLIFCHDRTLTGTKVITR